MTTLIELMGVYHDAGRNVDVLTLLDKAPNWGVSDLAELRAYTDAKDVSVLYYAAAALHGAGKDAQALVLLETLIGRSGGFDPGYELYTRIRGAAAIPFLEKIYAGDRFEERPLIWKAALLLHEKKLDEAERIARAAIAVDPSDGEEGPGDRMRAYAVLADILDARGNAADAALYRNAVQAIRDSEHADEFRLAGMHTRAIAMYTKALERFADAYCIQSRLAVELNASGNTLLAQDHYRRAYELMPSSFGRMESHCLGCENVFGGESAQGIAEKVFGDLVLKMPANPQVHYLLGYLREEQDRYTEALSQYRSATQLDADYLNAWKRQRDIAGSIDVPAAEQDRVALRLYELDPRGRHVYGVASNITDWPALYTLAVNAQAQFAAPHAELYPLATSARALAANTHASRREMLRHYQRYSDSDALPTAGGAIAGTGLMRALSHLIEMPIAEAP